MLSSNGNLPFEKALVALKAGKRIRRKNWPDPCHFGVLYLFLENDKRRKRQHIGAAVVDPGPHHHAFTSWIPHKDDVTAEDWQIMTD